MTEFFTALGALDYGNDLYRSVMVFVWIVTVLFCMTSFRGFRSFSNGGSQVFQEQCVCYV